MMNDPVPFPAFPSQKRFWFLDQLQPGNPFCNQALLVHLDGPLDDVRFNEAWGQLVERHESLRIYLGFVEGEVVQFEGDGSRSQVHRVECRPGVAPSQTSLEAVLASWRRVSI